MMRRLGWLLAAALLLGGCSSNKLVKFNPPAKLPALSPALQVTGLWSAQVGKGSDGYALKLGPAVGKSHVYVTARGGEVLALTRDGGRTVWKTDLKQEVRGGPAVAGSLVLVSASDDVVALNKADGKVAWRAPLSSEVLSPAVRSGDVVVVRTVDGHVFGLSASDGHRLWSYDQDVPLLTLRGTSAPVLSDGGDRVVVGFANGKIAALRVADGHLLWTATVAVPNGRTDIERMVDVDGRIVVNNGTVYAASYQGRLVAISLDSGQLLWERKFSSYSGIAADSGVLYVSDADGAVWALSRSDGATLWKQNALHGRKLTAPALQGNAVVVGDFQGYVHWLARADGHEMARARVFSGDFSASSSDQAESGSFDDGRAISAAPVVAGNDLYVEDVRGVVDAFHLGPLPKKSSGGSSFHWF